MVMHVTRQFLSFFLSITIIFMSRHLYVAFFVANYYMTWLCCVTCCQWATSIAVPPTSLASLHISKMQLATTTLPLVVMQPPMLPIVVTSTTYVV